MKILFNIAITVCFLFLCDYSIGQTVKIKDKPSKMKIKQKSTYNGQSASNNTNSQSNSNGLKNTAWKTYFGQRPITDTAIWRFKNDSSSLELTNGTILVHGVYTLNHDTLTFNDLGGKYSCPKTNIGKYTVVIQDDILTLKLIEDDCSDRSAIINDAKLQRIKSYNLQ